VSVHLSEEEQLEVLKRWWKEYGKTIIFAVLIAVGGYFGVTGWQNQQQAKAEDSSALYDDLITAVNVEPGQVLSAESKTTAEHLAVQLKEANSSSLYAHNAALLLAKLAVEAGDLEKAAAELNWVLSNKPNLATEQLTRLRLARVQIAQQAYDDAEKLLANSADAFKSEYAEARGDISRARGDLDAARTTYQQALDDTDPQQQERVMLLQLKLDDLKVSDLTTQVSTENAQ
jgi:predicted negative regulator of RcsB-dependent stress response